MLAESCALCFYVCVCALTYADSADWTRRPSRGTVGIGWYAEIVGTLGRSSVHKGLWIVLSNGAGRWKAEGRSVEGHGKAGHMYQADTWVVCTYANYPRTWRALTTSSEGTC